MKTGFLNLFEMVHFLVREGRPSLAEPAFDELAGGAEALTRRRIFSASEIRVRYRDRGLSYADAAGYATAQEIGATFFTTDTGFRGLPGVRVLAA